MKAVGRTWDANTDVEFDAGLYRKFHPSVSIVLAVVVCFGYAALTLLDCLAVEDFATGPADA